MSNGDQASRGPSPRQVILACCDVVMALAAAVAVATLALEHGFYDPPVNVSVLHVIQACVLAAFVADRCLRVLVHKRRREYLRQNWIDFALILGAGGVALAAEQFQSQALSAAAVYVVITQVYILAALVLRIVGLQVRVAGTGIHPILLLICSFVVVILFGTALLMLPRAVPDPAKDPATFTEALFTATSATCVTGLLVRDTETQFAPFGKMVILVLIQLGGLGIMIFGTIFALLARRALSVRETLLAGQVLSEATVGRIGRMVKFVILSAFAVEAVGGALMYPMWRRFGDGTAAQAAFSSAFHAVSAFCNAGFSLQSDSLQGLRHYGQIIGVMAPLIFLGGLGFPVLYDLVRTGVERLKRLLGRSTRATAGLTLHSKLVLVTSAALLIGGALGLLAIEHLADPGQTYSARLTHDDNPRARLTPAALRRLPPAERMREVVFQSVTARTAGFNTVDMDALSEPGKFWMCLLMIVGGSPASTAGGMKTVTLAVLALAIWSVLRRRPQTEGFRRSIAEPFVRKAMVVVGLYLALLATVTILLSVTMSGRAIASTGREATFMQLFFEACSACGTVGLTCGVTGSLTTFGQYVIIAAMFIGRLGPLTLLLALTVGVRPARYAYPNEEVVLG